MSIDIEAMATLVRTMENVSRDAPPNLRTIKNSLTSSSLTTTSTRPGDSAVGWVQRRLPDVRRRLSLSRAIAASSPSIKGVVTCDESLVPTISVAEARKRGRRAATLLANRDSTDIPDELLRLLAQNATDPYFAAEVRLDPAMLKMLGSRVASPFSEDGQERDPKEWSAYKSHYADLIESLGTTLGTASYGRGDIAFDRDAWLAPFSSRSAGKELFFDVRDDRPNVVVGGSADAGLHAMLMQYGSWDPALVTSATNQAIATEKDKGADFWRAEGYGDDGDYSISKTGFIRDTNGAVMSDPMVGLMRALTNNPDAARGVFAARSTAPVKVDGKDVPVSATMRYLFLERPWTDDQGVSLIDAVGAASFETNTDLNRAAQVKTDLTVLQNVDPPKKPNWFSTIGHGLLDVAGVFIDPADSVNAAWYTAEGRYSDAALSAAGQVPVLGVFAVLGKAVRGGDHAADAFHTIEVARLAREAGLTDETVGALASASRLDGSTFTFRDRLSFTAATREAVPGYRYKFGGTTWEVGEGGRLVKVDNPSGRLGPQTQWQHVRSLWRKGQEFNEQNWRRFTHNEVYVHVTDPATGKLISKGYLDSLNQGDWIISRKNRQYADLKNPHQLRKDIDDTITDYPRGATIQDTPTNRRIFADNPDLIGKPLDGTHVLEIPPQNRPLDPNTLKHADAEDVVIADPDGRIYTLEHPEGKLFTKEEMIETFGKELTPP